MNGKINLKNGLRNWVTERGKAMTFKYFPVIFCLYTFFTTQAAGCLPEPPSSSLGVRGEEEAPLLCGLPLHANDGGSGSEAGDSGIGEMGPPPPRPLKIFTAPCVACVVLSSAALTGWMLTMYVLLKEGTKFGKGDPFRG